MTKAPTMSPRTRIGFGKSPSRSSPFMSRDEAATACRQLLEDLEELFDELDHEGWSDHFDSPSQPNFRDVAVGIKSRLADPKGDPWSLLYAAMAVLISVSDVIDRLLTSSLRGVTVKSASAKGAKKKAEADAADRADREQELIQFIKGLPPNDPVKKSNRKLAAAFVREFGNGKAETVRKQIQGLTKKLGS